MRGYFGIGVEHAKTTHNVGTLWRSAHNLGADFLFTIGARYARQCSDTTKAWRSVPLYNYATFAEFYRVMPYDCRLVGVEYPDARAVGLDKFAHPDRAIYLLGSEDSGLTKEAKDKCHLIVMIPGSRLEQSLNVAVAGSIVMYDRVVKS